MGIFDGLFGGPKTTTAGSNPLWDLQQPHLKNIYDAAGSLYEQGAPGYYPGSTVAGFDPVRAQGINLGVDAALGPQQQLADAYSSGLLGIAQGTDPATQRLAQQSAAAVGQGAASQGALGSARAQLAQNTAAGDVIAGRQLQALQQIPQAQQAALAPATTLSGAGRTFQDYQQQITDADKQRYDYQANQPFNWLGQYRQAIGPAAAPTTQTQQTSQSPFNTLLGLGSTFLGGGGLLGGLFNQGGEVDGYQRGGQVPTRPVRGAAPGIYTPVDTVPTTYAGSNWQRPQSNYGWAIVDGRYQLVPSRVGTVPGGGMTDGGPNMMDTTPVQPVAPIMPMVDTGAGRDYTKERHDAIIYQNQLDQEPGDPLGLQPNTGDPVVDYELTLANPAAGGSGSLVTGGPTGINAHTTGEEIASQLEGLGVVTPQTDKALGIVNRDPNRVISTANPTTALEHAINRSEQMYQDQVAAGEIPAFDATDPSTWYGAEEVKDEAAAKEQAKEAVANVARSGGRLDQVVKAGEAAGLSNTEAAILYEQNKGESESSQRRQDAMYAGSTADYDAVVDAAGTSDFGSLSQADKLAVANQLGVGNGRDTGAASAFLDAVQASEVNKRVIERDDPIEKAVHSRDRGDIKTLLREQGLYSSRMKDDSTSALLQRLIDANPDSAANLSRDAYGRSIVGKAMGGMVPGYANGGRVIKQIFDTPNPDWLRDYQPPGSPVPGQQFPSPVQRDLTDLNAPIRPKWLLEGWKK